MEHSAKFEKVKGYYDKGLWNKVMVQNAVTKNWITADECKEILGEDDADADPHDGEADSHEDSADDEAQRQAAEAASDPQPAKVSVKSKAVKVAAK